MNLSENPILDMLFALVFIYAVLSILVSILGEYWNYVYDKRSAMLKEAINKLLNDDLNLQYGLLLYKHESVQAIFKSKPELNLLEKIINKFYKISKRDKAPTYISSNLFAETLIDVIASQANHIQKIERDETGPFAADKKFKIVSADVPDEILAKLKMAIAHMNNSPLKDLLEQKLSASNNNYDKLKKSLEDWFNDYMDRVSGWFKIKQRTTNLVFGFVVAIALNVDSLHLVKTLSLDSDTRNTLVKQAESTVKAYSELSDSSKQSTLQLKRLLIKVKIKEDSLALVMKEQKTKDSTPVDTTNTINKKINEYSLQTNKINVLLKLNDSLSKATGSSIDSVLSLLATSSIPIGYSRSTAPLSWKYGLIKDYKPSNSSYVSLARYNYNRDSGNFWVYIKYILGIIITGFSLSFGAPFWFEALVKISNLRQSGVKPTGGKSN